MKRHEFHSVFAREFNDFLDYRESTGIDISADSRYQKSLDDFLIRRKVSVKEITQALAEEWRVREEGESSHRHYMRINHTKRFLEYLYILGFPVVLIRDVQPPTNNFCPHIYTDDEIENYFLVIDNYGDAYSGNPQNRLQLSVLFRLLYCCGCRITETLMIRVKDVDLSSGVIKLKVTKGNKERYVVLSETLLSLLKEFAYLTFHTLTDDDFIFRNRYGQQLKRDWVEDLHERILTMAGIPAVSASGYRKRLHDWRHTFAVHAFKKMVDNGMDMYVSLPILSTYMGHASIAATERYVRLAAALYPYIQEKFDLVFDSLSGKEVTDEK